MTSSGITARETQQNPVLVFSITLTQKRVRPPVWIILVLHAELVSVRALLPAHAHIHTRTPHMAQENLGTQERTAFRPRAQDRLAEALTKASTKLLATVTISRRSAV